MDSPRDHVPTLAEWRRKNTAMFFRYLSRAMEKGLKVPTADEDGATHLKTISPKVAMTQLKSMRPHMFPPELTDKTAARKAYKKYGHWKKVDFQWVEIDKIGTPDGYVPSDECDEICEYWKKFIQDDIPIPAIRVYSDEDLTLIKDGVQRVKMLKEAGYKYVLVYFRYETNDDPP